MLANHDRLKIFKRVTDGIGRTSVACVIAYTDFRFYPMATLARDSFVHHHPGVDVFLVGPDQLPFFQKSLIKYVSGESWGIGPIKYHLAQQVSSMGYSKVICLGADTATFARLDEFIDDDSAHVITSLDCNDYLYEPLQEARKIEHCELLDGKPGNPILEYHQINSMAMTPDSNIESMQLNADVICFNDDVNSYSVVDDMPVRATDVLNPQKNFCSMFVTIFGVLAKLYPYTALGYREQGLLNLLLLQGPEAENFRENFLSFNQLKSVEPDFSTEELQVIYQKWIKGDWRYTVVDAPYETSEVSYNIRSIYENDESLSREEITNRVSSFYVKDQKIYNRDGKQIKILHFRDSITQLSLSALGDHINSWRDSFSKEVVDLLRSAGCKNFFDTDWDQWYKNTMLEATKLIPHATDNFTYLEDCYKEKEIEIKERRDVGEEYFKNSLEGKTDDNKSKS